MGLIWARVQNRGIIRIFADRPSTGKIAAFSGLLSRLPPGTVQRSAGTLAGIIRAYVCGHIVTGRGCIDGTGQRAGRIKGARHRRRLQRSGPGPGEKSTGGEGPGRVQDKPRARARKGCYDSK